MDQTETARGLNFFGKPRRGRVAIKRDHRGPRLKECATVTASSEGPIYDGQAGSGPQDGQHLSEHHRGMFGRMISDTHDAAAMVPARWRSRRAGSPSRA